MQNHATESIFKKIPSFLYEVTLFYDDHVVLPNSIVYFASSYKSDLKQVT